MKKQDNTKTTKARLVLNAERVRQLDEVQLGHVVGGGSTACKSQEQTICGTA